MIIIIKKKYVYNISQLWIYIIIYWVVLKKDYKELPLKKEAVEARDKYYENQSNCRGKLANMVYQKNPKFTLFTCDKPDFLNVAKKIQIKMEKVILV